ncbi:Pex12 amino terminal region-domain-containing protein [Lineolata rhizophorae]|uniref:RING-type E3 ubiquitin transferase n=1 Tax=Lineolata rhizophorae TaxID=578093 RepID=A0A6A6NYW9_9PEZI|nr:Pex12 amino terminal region-domain-containing protein [Lineolata rhizophorae]
MAAPARSHRYPYAASPDIIRSNQKDAYFSGVLYERVSAIARDLYGARFAHRFAAEAKTFAELLYFCLTTLVGNRTLGEEYCDIVQVEEDAAGGGGGVRLPSLARRAGYILSSVLLPYVLGKMLPAFRARVRSKLESNMRKAARASSRERHRDQERENPRKGPQAARGAGARRLSTVVQAYLLANLDNITSPAPVYAVSLATFYFAGAYYHIGKRLWRLRYVFTRQVEAEEGQRVGYEVLGVLLVAQLAVQGWLHMRDAFAAGAEVRAGHGDGADVSLDPTAYSSNNALLLSTGAPTGPGGLRSAEGVARLTGTPVLPGPRYRLDTEATGRPATMAWMGAAQQRRCTLCLEDMKDPAVTTCGHVFCWACIGDWCREKPECPLCRQPCTAQHVLPLRG